MSFWLKSEALLLLIGDIVIFYASLWLMLFLSYWSFSVKEEYAIHIVPFSVLFVVWIIIFFIAGLYEKHTLLLRGKLVTIMINTQIVNALIAVLFFYLIPYYGITPKTNLFVYLIVSFVFVWLWRLNGYKIFSVRKKQKAFLIASGQEMGELKNEVNNNVRYDIIFSSVLDLDGLDTINFEEEISKRVYSEDIQIIVADLRNNKVDEVLPQLYNLIFSGVRFIDVHRMYEDIFDRIPLSIIKYNWFLENVSTTSRITFSILKRIMDVIIAVPLGIVSLLFYPVVFIGNMVANQGPLFFRQERIGKNNKPIHIVKFRSMTEKGEEKMVTKFGAFLRKTRIDELPQIWNVIRGDISLIGPRPEIPSFVREYEEHIPYYNVRHLITPGLSGWAQLYHDNHPHHGSDVHETKVKLSYDLYYLKNRSVILDLKIALKTIKKLASRAGK